MKQVLIIGNGFDLACGLKSSYSDFFNCRFKKLFGKNTNDYTVIREIFNTINKMDSAFPLDYHDYFKTIINKFNPNKIDQLGLTRWDCIFLFAKDCLAVDNKELQWQDIENIIYNVVSIALKIKGFKTNLKFRHIEDFGNPAKQFFYKYVEKLCQVVPKSAENTASELLNSLYNFENVFAKFLLADKNFNSGQNAENLFKSLLIDSKSEMIPLPLTVDVLSFNYTFPNFNENLNYSFKNLEVNSWRNIHGLAKYAETVSDQNSYRNFCAPIFGIDNHDILKDNIPNDLRIMFTKSYRLIDNNVNDIKNKNKINYENTDVITVYGHSLGRADYSYFETIFDENNLYNSTTKLEIYYYEKMGKNNIKNKQKCINRVVSLLNNYGKTLGNTHGENIVNKMILEDRLEVLPSSSLAWSE